MGDIAKDNTNMPRAERAQLIGAAWKALSEEEKTKYEELATTDKERHKKEMEEFTPQVNNEAPKKPMSGKFCEVLFNAFILYINQQPYPTYTP